MDWVPCHAPRILDDDEDALREVRLAPSFVNETFCLEEVNAHSNLDRNQISILFGGFPIYISQIHIFKFQKVFLILIIPLI